MASDDQVINSISNSLGDLENTLARFIAKTEAATKKFGDSMKKLPPAAQGAAGGVEKAFKGSSSAAANLSFQLNDIGMMMASGQNPFMLMIQQGSQVSQIMGEIQRGGGSVGQVLKGAFTQLVNPMGLVSMALIGLSAYAVQYFTTVEDGGKDAEKALKEQEQLIDGVASAWGELLPTLKAIREQQKELASEGDKKKATELVAIGEYEEFKKVLDKLAPALDGINVRLDETSQARTPAGLATGFDALVRSAEKGRATIEQLDAVIAKVKALPNQSAATYAMVEALTAQRAALIEAESAAAKLRKEESLATTEKKNAIEFQKDLNKLNGEQISAVDKITQEYKDYMESIRESTNQLKLAIEATEKYHAAIKKAEEVDLAKAVEEMAKFGPEISKFEGFMLAYAEALSKAKTEQDALNVQTKGFAVLQGQLSAAGNTWMELGQKAGDIWTKKWDGVHDSIDGANSAVDAYVKRVQKAEGTAQNPNSSAVGEGQFINKTWIGMMEKYNAAGIVGLDKAGILALRSNSELALTMVRRYAEESAKSLALVGIQATEADLHLAHFLGSGDAIKVLQAAPGTPLKGLIQDASIAANPEVLGGGKVREDVLAYARARAQATVADKEHKSAVDTLMTSMNEQLASQQRQNAINGDTTKTVDQKTFALLKEEAMTKLLSAAQQDNATVTKEQQASFDALATKMATAGLSAEQLKTKQAELKKQQDELTQNTEALAAQYNDMASQAISGFINDLRHGVSAGEAFSKMLDTLIGQLIEMAVKALIMKSGLGAALAGLTGGGVAASGAVGLKAGGTIGFTGGPQSAVSAGAFGGARSMAGGGIIGGDPNAIPIVGHRGEIVIPKSALMKSASLTSGRGGDKISVGDTSIKVDIANGTGETNVSTQGGIAFGRMLDGAVQAIIVRESRPGGLLRNQMPGERR